MANALELHTYLNNHYIYDMEEKKTTKKKAPKKVAPKKVDPKKAMAEKIDKMIEEIGAMKAEYRAEINTSSHALLNKTIADFSRISRILKK